MHSLHRIWCSPQHLGTQCVPPCIIIAVILRQIFNIDSSWVFFRSCGGCSGHSSKISQNLLGLITLCGFHGLLHGLLTFKDAKQATLQLPRSFSPSLVLSLSHKFVKHSLITQVPLETCHVEICTLTTKTCHHSSIGSDAVSIITAVHLKKYCLRSCGGFRGEDSIGKNTFTKSIKTVTDDKPYSFGFVKLREHDVK